MSVYDRGGSVPKPIEALKRQGVEKVGLPPRGQAKWCLAEAGQPEVRSQRGKTEGDRHAQESEGRFQSPNREKQRNVNGCWAAGEGV
jgi:hypothetical protein